VLPVRLPAWLAWSEPFLVRLFAWRYFRFATVGASGTVVNIAVLYVMQEWVLPVVIASPDLRLSVALVGAIAVATINNFAWNSLWTWADRLQAGDTPNLRTDLATGNRLFKYTLSSWLGILIQYSLTLWLSAHMYYLVANVLSILLASVSNFLANDKWTFRQKSVDDQA
jgi:dolichol-phosphate mannosyltransferase